MAPISPSPSNVEMYVVITAADTVVVLRFSREKAYGAVR